MRRYVFRLAIVTLALLGASAVRGDDQQIAQQIIEKYKAAKSSGSLQGFSIDLQVDEGTVWLSGRVANEQQQAQALDIARRVPGVKQVVNDLEIAVASKNVSATQRLASSMGKYFRRDDEGSSMVQPASAYEGGAIGSGIDPGASGRRQAGNVPYAAAPAAPRYAANPGYAANAGGVPLAMAPARTINYQGAVNGTPGAPIPMHLPGSGVGIAPARYDHPSMPGYAWPSYAAYPNYAAVTYPKQYSPTAWPYIGPFYPYPQVPLGWRKVTLEWDDGWWFLDFKDRRHPYYH
jgi:hypothetical protein